MLTYTDFNFSGYADVQALKAAGHDVDVRLLDHGEILQRETKCGGPSTALRFGRDDAVFW
jgi:hypothetical protein